MGTLKIRAKLSNKNTWVRQFIFLTVLALSFLLITGSTAFAGDDDKLPRIQFDNPVETDLQAIWADDTSRGVIKIFGGALTTSLCAKGFLSTARLQFSPSVAAGRTV